MPKVRTTVSLPEGMREEAAKYQVNMSKAAEEGIAAALKKEKEEAWKRDNADLIEAINRDIDENGLALEKYRTW